MITDSNITFGDCKVEGREYIQSINFNDIMIGVLIQKEKNSLSGINEKYQFGCKEEHINNCNYEESEDIGWMFIVSNTLDEFLININNCIKNGHKI